ncbi:MAG: HAMP domain-containing histidine kinase [Deltaproteobacteria bacterium]|nr:HAMP domain-containing histidine kinase [Deltaproteobacteria bacterium]
MPYTSLVQAQRASRSADQPIHASLTDLHWLTRLRWVAAVATCTVTSTVVALDWATAPLPLAVAGLTGLVTNGLWHWLLVRHGGLWSPRRLDQVALAQISLDVLTLATLLHYGGGVDNPFDSLFALHVAIAATLLPRRSAGFVALLSALAHSLLVLGPLLGWLQFHPLRLAFEGEVHHEVESLPQGVLYLLAHWAMLAGVVYLTGTLRTRQQAAERARQAQELLARNNEKLARIGAISAGVAHSVRNPLHGALNCVDILAQTPDAPLRDNADLLPLLREALQRIDQVTQRLLTLTRSEAATRHATHLGALLHECVQQVQPHAHEHAVAVQLTVSPLPELAIDAVRIREALQNLLDNAIDASPAGTTVEVTAGADAEVLWIEVRDRGEGIAPDTLARVFEPFFTTKAVGDGTGIGLPIARRAVRDHGGDLVLRSELGAGTVARVELPLQAGEVAPADPLE